MGEHVDLTTVYLDKITSQSIMQSTSKSNHADKKCSMSILR